MPGRGGDRRRHQPQRGVTAKPALMSVSSRPQSIDELRRIPKEVPHPLLVNMLTGGVTPILTVDELQALGYKIVVCPIESLLDRRRHPAADPEPAGEGPRRSRPRVDADLCPGQGSAGAERRARLARATAITNLYEGEAMTRALMLSCCLVALLVGCAQQPPPPVQNPTPPGRPEGHPDQRAGNQRQR